MANNTMLPPAGDEAVIPGLCASCATSFALQGKLCVGCKVASDNKRHFITKQIQAFEELYAIAFTRTDDYIFPDEFEASEADIPTLPAPEDLSVDVDTTELDKPKFEILETSVDSDKVLHYHSNTTNTDDYIP